MATGGDLLFQGGPNEGVVRAFNARTGELVWTFRTGSNFRNSPITYIGPDGRQYVAVIGSQAPANQPVTPETAPDAGARFRRSGTTLYVFALPLAFAAARD
jgi:outer membrane protein assembly factor BamB